MKQKTLWHDDVEKLDKLVNDFDLVHKTKATQSYFANGNHYRVLFYEV
jgi:hypothetical protein